MKKTQERKAMLKKRREDQLSRVPSVAQRPRGKYIPSGVLKNTKPENR